MTEPNTLKNGITARALAPVFAAALALRLLLLLLLNAPHTNSDTKEYLDIAANLAASGAYTQDGATPDHTRAPGYPVFLAAASLLPGAAEAGAQAAQCVLDSLSAVLVVLLAASFFGRRAALLAGLAYAAHPVFAGLSRMLLSETLFMFLWLGFMCLLARGLLGGRERLFAAAGFVLGLAVLTRPAHMFYPAALLPVFFFLDAPLARRLRGFALLAAVFALTLAPWTARNYGHFRRVIPVCTGSALALWIGSMPQLTETLELTTIWPGKDMKSFEAEAVFLAAAKKNWRENYPALILFLPVKLARFWTTSHSAVFGILEPNRRYLDTGRLAPLAFKLFLFGVQFAVLAGGLAGAWLLRRDWRRLLVLVMPALYVSAHILNDCGPSRYHISALPPLFILALGALEAKLSGGPARA